MGAPYARPYLYPRWALCDGGAAVGDPLGDLRMAIGPVTGVGTSFALGSVPPASRLIGGGGALEALGDSRDAVAQIAAALTTLRDALTNARNSADAVPGDSTLTPVTVAIPQTIEQPTFVTVNGEPVQSGIVNVPAGTRTLTVGYERSGRAPLAVGDTLRSLAAQVAALNGSVGTGDFAAQVSALLRSGDLAAAVNTPDVGAIDAAVGEINGVLAAAGGLGQQLGARTQAAAQVNLGGLLLSADAGAVLAAQSGGSFGGSFGGSYQAAPPPATGSRLSHWA